MEHTYTYMSRIVHLSQTYEFNSDQLQTVTSTHPVDEKGLDELDNLQCDQKTDGDQVVEQNDEGEEVEAKVSRPSICHDTGFR